MSRTPSATGLALVTVPAAALVAVGGVVVVRPALVFDRAPELRSLLASVDPGLVVLALAVVLVVVAPTLGIVGRLRSSSTRPLVGVAGVRNPSSAPPNPFDRRRVVGASLDEQIALATAYDDEPRDIRAAARETLLESLRTIAATAYANRAGRSADEARAAIEAGEWTDDPRAAAFLAAENGPSTPLWLWLVDLLTAADPFERQLERTLDEIERLQSTATVAEPPRRRSAGESSASSDADEDATETIDPGFSEVRT